MNSRYLTSAIVIAALAGTATLSGCSSESSLATGNKDPLKIVIIPPSSGTFAEMGQDAKQGWQYAVDEANASGGVAGHPVELIVKDTDASVSNTVRALTEAVNQDEAQFVSGVMTSPENVAVFQQAKGLNVVALNHVGQAGNLVGEACSSNGFTTVQSTDVNIKAMSGALSQIPGKKWAFLNADYATGHDVAAEFKEAVEKNGGEIVSNQFAPLGTTDFGSQITKIKDSGADAVLLSIYGADLTAFTNQAAQYKLDDKVKTVVGISAITENLFPALGEKIKGWYGNVLYDVNADNEANKKFVEGYSAKYNEKPYYFPANAYIAAQALFAAVTKAGSTNPENVRDALSGLTFDSLNGQVTMRPQDHRLISPVYAAQVVDNEDGMAWKTFLTVPASDLELPPNPECKLSE
jgi:branched-chain amino acid transport system substrate-binding protein